MPLYDYHCTACQAGFELLVRSSTVPVCPHCGSSALERQVCAPAPPGKSAAIIRSNRRHAAAQGHFSNFSPSERAKLLK